jgi:hypothetical protein
LLVREAFAKNPGTFRHGVRNFAKWVIHYHWVCAFVIRFANQCILHCSSHMKVQIYVGVI